MLMLILKKTMIMMTQAKVKIGGHVMFAPNVLEASDNHRIDFNGKYMSEVKDEEKLP